jgi:hypothetical protein
MNIQYKDIKINDVVWFKTINNEYGSGIGIVIDKRCEEVNKIYVKIPTIHLNEEGYKLHYIFPFEIKKIIKKGKTK